jgi:hypothetical protein
MAAVKAHVNAERGPAPKGPAPVRPAPSSRTPAVPLLWVAMRKAISPAPPPAGAAVRVSSPGDRLEKEADRVAEEVTKEKKPRTTSPPAGAAAPRPPEQPPSQPACKECSKLGPCASCRGLVQRVAIAGPVAALAPAFARAPEFFPGSAGRPLDATVRHDLEPRFGLDFGAVRVHTGPDAVAAAGDLSARAFTVGPNIFFGRGEYAPETAGGRRLLAHELAHVFQQGQRSAPPMVQRAPQERGRDEARGIEARLDAGQPLAAEVADRLGPTVGIDLGKVRVHTGAPAASLARQLDAQAFTVGRHIAFRDGAYRPGTSEGDALLAHELTHVAQQAAGDGPRVQRKPDASGARKRRQVLEEAIDAAREAEAERAERRAIEARRQEEEQFRRDLENLKKAGRPTFLSALFPAHTAHTLRTQSQLIQNPLLRFHAEVAERARSTSLLAAALDPIARPIATVLEFFECMFAHVSGESADAILDTLKSHPLDLLNFRENFNEGVAEGIIDEVVSTAKLIKELVTHPMAMVEEGAKLMALLWSPQSMEIACALGADMGEEFDKHLKKLAGQGVDAIAKELGKLAGPFVLWTLVGLIAPEVVLAVKGTKFFKRVLKLLDKAGDVVARMRKLAIRKPKRPRTQAHGDGPDAPDVSKVPPPEKSAAPDKAPPSKKRPPSEKTPEPDKAREAQKKPDVDENSATTTDVETSEPASAKAPANTPPSAFPEVAGRAVKPLEATATRYRWQNPRMPEGNFIKADMNNGALSVTVRSHGPNELRRGGLQLIDDVFKHFGDANIRQFDGVWVRRKAFDRNYREYLANLAKNMTPEDAAFDTWIGRELRKRGFTKVEVPSHVDNPDLVTPVFRR